jgi:hypothetical protein
MQPTLPLQQNSPLQMYPQGCVDILISTVGLCEALSHANPPKHSVQTSHTQILQRLQSKLLRTLANDPWFISNLQLQTDLGTSFVTADIRRYSLRYRRLA